MASQAEVKIESNIEKINGLLDTLIQKLNTLASNEGFDKLANKSGKAQDNLAKTAAKVQAAWLVATKAVGAFNKVINETQSTMNRVNRIMGEGADDAKDYANQLQKMVGIRAADFLKAQSVIYQSAIGMGQSAKNAQIMSQNITQLSYDMAAFYGDLSNVDNYLSGLQNGLTGNAKQLRNLGFALTEADLRQEALLEGLDVNIRDLNTASKSLLRYNAIIRQSANMQGSYVNSFMTLSTAQGVLHAQIKELYNSIGTLLYPILMKIIPYMIGFVKLLDSIIRSIAGLLGIELPTIDATPTTQAFNDIADEAEKTGKAIEKSFTLGIDELNVLDDTASNAGSGIGNMDITGMAEPLSYDFLANYEGSEAQKFFQNIEDNLDTIKIAVGVIGTAILAWKVNEAFQSTLDLLKNKKFLQNLKTTAGITLVISGFTMEFSAAKAIGKGDDSVENYIKLAIGSAMGILGSVLLISGPAGWIIGISAALAIAVSGITIGMNEQISEAVADEFYNGNEGSITITDLTDQVSTLLGEIEKLNTPLVESGEKLKDFGDKADASATQVSYIATAIAKGYESANINIPQLEAVFSTFADNTYNYFNQIYDTVTLALVTSLADAVEESGGNIDEYLRLIGKLKDDTITSYTELTNKADELRKQYEIGKLPMEEYATELANIQEQMDKLRGKSDPVKTAMSGVSDAIENFKINWESEEAKRNAFDKLEESAKSAKQSVEESTGAMITSIEKMLEIETAKGTLTDETKTKLETMLASAYTVREQQMAEIEKQVIGYGNQIQVALINGLQGQMEKGKEVYEGYNLGQEIIAGLFNYGEVGTVEKTVQEYADKYVDPISTELQTIMSDLGIEGKTWAAEASAQIIDAVFDYEYAYTTEGKILTHKNYGENIEEAIKKELSKVETSLKTGALNTTTTDIGKNVDVGMSQGIDDNVNLIEKSAKSLADIAPRTVRELLQIQSPSQVFAEIGQYVDEGFANGITENSEQVETAMNTMLNTLLEKAETFCNRMRDGFNKVLSELSKSMSSLKIEDNVATFTKIPKITIKQFETGGYPTSGDLFFANENGTPELVGRVGNRTVVANNDQIFQGIYQAVSAGMANMTQQPIEVTSVAVLDGETVYRNQQRVASRKGYNMGGGAFAHV